MIHPDRIFGQTTLWSLTYRWKITKIFNSIYLRLYRSYYGKGSKLVDPRVVCESI